MKNGIKIGRSSLYYCGYYVLFSTNVRNCHAVELHFEGYEYKTITYTLIASAKPHKSKGKYFLLRDRESYNLERAQAVYPFVPS